MINPIDTKILQQLQRGVARWEPLTADAVSIPSMNVADIEKRLKAMVRSGKVTTVKHGSKTLYHPMVKLPKLKEVKLPPRDCHFGVYQAKRRVILALSILGECRIADTLEIAEISEQRARTAVSALILGGVVAQEGGRYSRMLTLTGEQLDDEVPMKSSFTTRVRGCLKMMDATSKEISAASGVNRQMVDQILRETARNDLTFKVGVTSGRYRSAIWSSKPPTEQQLKKLQSMEGVEAGKQQPPAV